MVETREVRQVCDIFENTFNNGHTTMKGRENRRRWGKCVIFSRIHSTMDIHESKLVEDIEHHGE